MAFCQYEYTRSTRGEPGALLYEIKCVWCHKDLWIQQGDFPRDWCEIRPDHRPYTKCKHRGASHKKIVNKICGACPKGELVPVFTCAIHGECSDTLLQHNQKMMHCLKCFHDNLGFEPKEQANASDLSSDQQAERALLEQKSAAFLI